MVGGFLCLVGGLTGKVFGGAATVTGVGAAVGVPAIVVSVGLVAGGAANIEAGYRGLLQALKSPGSGSSGPPAASTTKSVPNPDGSRGGPEHRAAIDRRIEELKASGHEHTHGGKLKEEFIRTPGGTKGSRRPDITTRAPDGSTYRENVGRSTSSGDPVSRERQALDDIGKAKGARPGFTAYDR
jgi:hypothetical protein